MKNIKSYNNFVNEGFFNWMAGRWNEAGDIIEGNVVYTDGPASPEIEKITYFDDDGIEYNVNVDQKKIRADYRRI